MTVQQAIELGMGHHQAGRLAEAEGLYRKVLAAEPNQPDALHLLGVLALSAGKADIAIDLIRRAIEINPRCANYNCTLGEALASVGRSSEAVAAHQRAIVLDPTLPEAHSNLGNALLDMGLKDDAIASVRRAIELRPAFAEAHNNLGYALYAAGHVDEAIASYRQAIALNPQLAQAHNGLGVALLYSHGRAEEPEASFKAALAAQSGYAAAHFNLGLLRLLHGDYERGWVDHEWRFKIKQLNSTNHAFSQPRWNGGELNGRRILLTHEQGFGDALQFARYVPMVRSRGGRVILECRRELVELFGSIGGSVEIAGTDQPLPEFDVHCPLMSLPLVFKTTLQNIPAPVPYLRADVNRSSAWRDRIKALGAGFRVGLAWAGRPENGINRSITLAQLASLLEVPQVKFISLQKDVAGQSTMGQPLPDGMLTDWAHELSTFAETAALIDNLDLIITVDTAVAHLAGAMGKPVWILLRFVPDWRWMLGRDDSPWYPTMRLFRQPTPGDWATPIRSVVQEMQGLM